MNMYQRTSNLVFKHPEYFALKTAGRRLRSYQREVLTEIVRSIRHKAGRSFVVIFARQSGKNELQAQMQHYLLAVLQRHNINIVSISPTFKPQTINAMSKLETVLSRSLITRHRWKRSSGYIYHLDKASLTFLSGDPSANVVGDTAHVLLSVDEAQDIGIAHFDKAFAPMTAANNATRVFWGTSWTSDTLLARELRLARQAEQTDGFRRVWIVDGNQVANEVPAYRSFLNSEITRLGRNHPIVRTQYFCEEIDAQAGMFPPARRALMIGAHREQTSPTPGNIYAFLLDVAGVDETTLNNMDGLTNPGRDSHTLTIVEIDLSSLADLQKPTYRAVHRIRWTGQNHVIIFGQLKALAEAWNMRHFVMDATGAGEGLWSMAFTIWKEKVIAVKFNPSKKSEIGWGWLAIIETGRWREYAPFDAQLDTQLDKCKSEVLIGPAKTLKWGVPEGTRADGILVHDDDIFSAALSAELDTLEWTIQTEAAIVHAPDPLADMSKI